MSERDRIRWKTTLGLMLPWLFLMNARADKPPESMPLKAAQDLDYALYSQARKAKKIYERYRLIVDEEVKQATKEEFELINRLQNQYSFRLADEKGQPLDAVDPDTGKIKRKAPPAEVAKKGSSP